MSENAQDEVAQARARLLQGRGPGADPREIARVTRDRTEIGGVAVPVRLEVTAARAAAARGDVGTLADEVTRQQQRVAADLSVVADRVRGAAGTARLVAVAATVALAVGALAGWLARSRIRSPHGSRSTGSPPATRPDRARRR